MPFWLPAVRRSGGPPISGPEDCLAPARPVRPASDSQATQAYRFNYLLSSSLLLVKVQAAL